jgi:hypothetical protein
MTMRKILTLTLLTALTACAGDVQDIDRTQVGVMDKDFFDGEWYAKWTIVDVPYTTGFAFTGLGEGLERVKFDIRKGNLVAYRSYDFVDGSDEPHEREGAEWQGPMIYSFPIQGHFDVERGFNPATGEQSNTLVENRADCEWYECKQLRVDWNSNIRWRAPNGSYYVQEGDDEDVADRIVVDKDGGYMDVTIKGFMAPEVDQELSRYYGFPIPKCWLYSSPYQDCRGQTISFRISFMKIPKDRPTFKKVSFNDHRMSRFGFFRTTRFHRHEDYGTREANRDHYANIHNIWAKSVNDDGSEIPMAQREPKPVVYYLNDQFPGAGANVDLSGTVTEVEADWDKTLRAAVASAKGIAADSVPQMFYICPHNPVLEGDPAACGAAGTTARIGDIRYNMLYWVPTPQMGSPGGYGPSNTDPLTGEVISSHAYIYGAGYETAAASITDLVRLLLGDLEQESYIDGSDLADQIARADRRWAAVQARGLTKPDVRQIARRDGINHRARQLAELLDQGALESNSFEQTTAPLVQAGLAKPLSSPELMAMATGGVLTGNEPKELLERHNALSMARVVVDRIDQKLTEGGMKAIDFALFRDDAMLHIARRMKQRFGGDYEAIRAELLRKLFKATALHEIGHNMGLRHNFAASTDALNYNDGYWAMKGEFGMLDPEFIMGSSQEAALSERTDANGASVREYQYSSVMDYGGRWYSDLQGLGKYDTAAIKYAYANKVEVWDYEGAAEKLPENTRYTWTNNNLHYTTYPRILAGLPIDAPVGGGTVGGQPIADVVGLIKQRADIDVSDNDQVAEGMERLRVPYRFCSDEYAGGSNICHRFDEGADVYETVRDRISKHEGYRPIAAVSRDRIGWHTGWSYMGWALGAYDFLSLQYKHFVNEEFIIRRGWDCVDPKTGNSVLDDDGDARPHFFAQQCGMEQYYAALIGVEFFVKTLQTPDLGTYYFDTLHNEYRKDVDPTDPAIDANDTFVLDGANDSAQGYLSQWDPDRYGYYSFIKPTYAGFWMDKWAALSFITDTSSNFIGVDASSDTRSFQINFLNLFGDNLHQLISGIVLDEPSLYGPGYDPAEEEGFKYTDRTHIFTNSPGIGSAKVINPSDRFFTRYVALIMATAWAVQQTNNRDMNQNFKIGLKGSIDGAAVPADVAADPARYLELMDPVTDRTYFAVRTEHYGYSPLNPDYTYVPVGYEMLSRIRDQWYDADLIAGGGNPPAMSEWSRSAFKAEVMDVMRARALAHDGGLAGAELDAAAQELARREVHKEFFWVNQLRAMVNAYEMY